MMRSAALVAAFLLTGCAGVDLAAIKHRHAAELKMVIAEANMVRAIADFEQAKADFEAVKVD